MSDDEVGDELEPFDEPPGPKPKGEAVVEGLATGAAAGILLLDPTGIGIVLATLLPFAAKQFHAIDLKVWKRRVERGNRALTVAAEQLDIGIEEIVEKATESDPRTELLGRVIEAAASTVTLEEKIDALGRALAMGLDDDAKIDESIDFVRVLSEFEVSHVRVLKALFDLSYARLMNPGAASLMVGTLDVNHRNPPWNIFDIRAVTGMDLSNSSIIGVLVSNGACNVAEPQLAMSGAPRGLNLAWDIANFGCAILELLDYEPAIATAATRIPPYPSEYGL